MIPFIQITADEVNHIIYSYLLDSGFAHTAFTLKIEGRLEQSSHFNDFIPRGELVELLTKALLYAEVETHCKADGLITDCKTPFSLLKRHECSVELLDDSVSVIGKKSAHPVQAPQTTTVTNGISETSIKRKATSPVEGDAREKRSRRSEDVEELSVARQSAERNDFGMSSTDGALLSVGNQMIMPNGAMGSRRRNPSPGHHVLNPGAVLMLTGHEEEVFVGAWNPARPSLLATGSKDATVRIWDLPDPPVDPSQSLSPPSHPPVVLRHISDSVEKDITCIDWSPNGKLISTGSLDAILRVWTTGGELHMSHPQHQGAIFSVRFSKSGRWLLSSSLDGTACVWDIAERKLRMQFRCYARCCLETDWLDDDTFATCGADGLIHIMQIGTVTPLLTFEGHSDEVNQIKFSPSNRLLASGSDDGTARIWSLDKLSDTEDIPGLGPPVTTEHPSIVLAGHTDSIVHLGWCPKAFESNEILATTSIDGTARLWNASTGECIRLITDHSGVVYSMSFNSKGTFFATVSGDGWLYVYDMKTGSQVWSWHSGQKGQPGIYEIDWQQTGSINRMAMFLQSNVAAVLDVAQVPELAQS